MVLKKRGGKMKKSELVRKYEETIYAIISTEKVLNDLRQLDEPKEKVTLPRPVANWISCVRGRNKTLHFALENAPEEVNLWFCEDEKNRQNIFADVWVNGYHIEKEKRYYVRLKGVDENYNYFNCIKHLNAWCLTELKTDKKFRMTHTRKQLEDAGFGWVFDCPVEIYHTMKRRWSDGLTKLYLSTTRTSLALWFDLGQCDSV